MDTIVPIIVQLIGGAVGGNVLAQIVKQFNLNPTWNTIAGAIGGLVLTWICGRIPGLDAIVGAASSAAGTAATAGGAAASTGMQGGALAGQGIAGIVGGAVLTAIVGAIKNSRSSQV